ncbi:MAG: proton-conducting transporter membrane subunit [Dehalococcoidia bacterium]
MPIAAVLLPAGAGALAFLLRSTPARRALLVLTAVLHTAIVGSWWLARPAPVLGEWIGVDALGLIVITIASVLFLVASIYAVGYLAREGEGVRPDFFERGRLFANEPEAVFIGALLFFLAAMSLTAVAHHFGLVWVAIEATTLTSAPLLYFHRHERSLEATWKYLVIGSVGIAVALLGTFFLAAAALTGGVTGTALVESYTRLAGLLNAGWLKAAFIAFLVGYGTKVGLAPMHTWLPDAHSEAPSVVSALLSGALLNTAFLGILRLLQVMTAAGLGDYARELLLLFGFTSMAVAAAFIVAQRDYKRMLAYSSVEHMGIIATGVAMGGAGVFGAMLHEVNHSVAKALLFLVAGNILGAYQTKEVGDVRGLKRRLPISGALWFAGFLAITGTPPFGAFLSEFTILRAAIEGGRWLVTAWYLGLLGVVFVGMAAVFIGMTQGPSAHPREREAWLAVLPSAVLAVIALTLGVYVPGALAAVAHEAARSIGGA